MLLEERHYTKRQNEVMEKLLQGLTDKEIGAQLFISEETVGMHLRRLFQMLQVRNRTSLIIKYTRTCRV